MDLVVPISKKKVWKVQWNKILQRYADIKTHVFELCGLDRHTFNEFQHGLQLKLRNYEASQGFSSLSYSHL